MQPKRIAIAPWLLVATMYAACSSGCPARSRPAADQRAAVKPDTAPARNCPPADVQSIIRAAKSWDGGLEAIKEGIEKYEVYVDCTDEFGSTALSYACYEGHEKVVRYLLDKGADPGIEDDHGSDAAYEAVMGSKLEILKLLKHTAGIDLKKKYPDGNTLLHPAAMEEKGLETARYLIEQGLDVNARSDLGLTPVHLAVEYPRTVKLLLDSGAKVPTVDIKGTTALMSAAMEGAVESVKLLLAAGSRIDQTNSVGLAAVHYAAFKNQPESVKLLLERGADPTIVAKKTGKDALQYSKGKPFEKLVRRYVEKWKKKKEGK